MCLLQTEYFQGAYLLGNHNVHAYKTKNYPYIISKAVVDIVILNFYTRTDFIISVHRTKSFIQTNILPPQVKKALPSKKCKTVVAIPSVFSASFTTKQRKLISRNAHAEARYNPSKRLKRQQRK